MNDPSITWYLRKEISSLAREIKIKYQDMESFSRRIVDLEQSIAPLKVHYTSLLNTLLAYGQTVKDLRESGYDTLEQED